MEISSLLFALGLLMAGIWLIFIISGDVKEKQSQAQRIPDLQRRRHHAARHVSPGARGVAGSRARQPLSVSRVAATDALSAGVERTAPIDEVQGWSVAFVRERFERFTHETRRTR